MKSAERSAPPTTGRNEVIKMQMRKGVTFGIWL